MSKSEMKLVIFTSGKGKYAIAIDNVERIIGYNTITPLPETSDYVLGLLTYQESILPVIDLNKRFYKEGILANEESKILVVQLEEYNLGILVSSVDEIKTINGDEIEKPSGIIKGISPEYILGLIKKGGEITVLLEVEKILREEQEKELTDILTNN